MWSFTICILRKLDYSGQKILTCRLPLLQYWVSIQIFEVSTHAPMNRFMLGCWTSSVWNRTQWNSKILKIKLISKLAVCMYVHHISQTPFPVPLVLSDGSALRITLSIVSYRFITISAWLYWSVKVIWSLFLTFLPIFKTNKVLSLLVSLHYSAPLPLRGSWSETKCLLKTTCFSSSNTVLFRLMLVFLSFFTAANVDCKWEIRKEKKMSQAKLFRYREV